MRSAVRDQLDQDRAVYDGRGALDRVLGQCIHHQVGHQVAHVAMSSSPGSTACTGAGLASSEIAAGVSNNAVKLVQQFLEGT
jgi:hypothetical protein